MTGEPVERRAIAVQGVVQGVGFRPFIYQLAGRYGLSGWVSNTSGEVRIEVQGTPAALDAFTAAIRTQAPPQARITNIMSNNIPPVADAGFVIRPSVAEPGRYQLISPDLAVCDECRAEIFQPGNRRYRYPFTNCTNCGPRFTIIEDIPYDRPLTTMKAFTMCPACQGEYDDPLDRRFHAQPNACPDCGPRLRLTDSAGRETMPAAEPLATAAGLLKNGHILAVRGLGGFLLACDATDPVAVAELRQRKRRPAKPFAVMLADLAATEALCQVSPEEARLLKDTAAPIVLLRLKENGVLAPGVAPGLRHLGVMLAYTPLHHLLMADVGRPLVMTSGNLAEEPIARDNDEALTRLGGIADYFLLHDRDIFSRYDDSVVMYEAGATRPLRRARGYAPYPVRLAETGPQVLAVGAQEKNTFCLTRDNHAFVSQHLGDLESPETLDHFEETLALFRRMFRIAPEAVVADRHPDYVSSRWAEQAAVEAGVPLLRVQHHHAHIAACLAENQVSDPVIGIALDGTGYGDDGRIWGSEFLEVSPGGFGRLAHLEYLPLTGGEAAVRRPWRTAAGYLYRLFGADGLTSAERCLRGVNGSELAMLAQQVDRGLNTPETSSAGRLFDAVAALIGIRTEIQYDAQAAVELEAAAEGVDSDIVYPFDLDTVDGLRQVRLGRLFQALLDDIAAGATAPAMAARFHDTIVDIIVKVCRELRADTGLNRTALSGGCFMNRRLLRGAIAGLEAEGFTVYTHREVPANDGGLSLGQAAVAARILKNSTGGLSCV
ncbi:(NiFe) hydrogenase maturation protein HypF [Dehalogenimonas lykanthroporepellens BL-DC-9]|nr:(NiFe) hydrogenase maturation protein HypF [Dehalogenimonas lykanthroporepellens BL-DC-9]